MSKGLEALEKLYNEREYTYAESVNHKSDKWKNDIEHYDNIGSCLLVIEKELEDYECLNNFFEKLKNKYEIDDLDYLEYIVRNYEKNKQVLEIIKKKPEYLIHVIIHKDYKSFIDSYIKRFPDVLTETEFNLIKEWLEK